MRAWLGAAVGGLAALGCSDSLNTGFTPGTGPSSGAGAASGATGSSAKSSGATGAGGQLTVTVGSGATGSGGSNEVNCGTMLTGTLRDFSIMHPDFEHFLGDDKGIVQNTLGPDHKPVYAGNPTTPTTTGKADFDQWWHDVPGVNYVFQLTIPLTDMGNGIWGYDNQAFFPIDNKGWGNEGLPHNYAFCYELHTSFRYHGSETFSFAGDDDVWVFINSQLAINLGGVHATEEASVDLKANEGMLGITVGKVYPLEIFYCERHTVASDLKVQTTIGDFVDCGTPK